MRITLARTGHRSNRLLGLDDASGFGTIAAVRYLGPKGAIFHVHAKDTKIDPIDSGIQGNLDVKSRGNILARGRVFRSIGYGYGQGWWNDFVTSPRMVG